MSRTEGAAGKIQGFSLIEIRNGLKNASTRISQHIEREPGKRPIEYGLALSRLAAWFLVQPPEVQTRIIEAGHAIVEDLRRQDEPHAPLDGEFAREVGLRHPDASLERWAGDCGGRPEAGDPPPEAPPRRGAGGLGEDRTLGSVHVPIYGRKRKGDGGSVPEAKPRRVGRGQE